jgi:cytochrome c-type biogenesis protein CcmH/NrfG
MVLLLVAVLAFYLLLIGVRGVSLLGDHRWTVKALGVGILLLPVVGVAIVVAELRFGRATERLAAQLRPDPDPADDLPPDEAFAQRKLQVEAAPEDWQAWYRLAVAYGNARDTARGRRAMRRAIALERAAASPPPRKPRNRDSGAA